MTQSFPAEQARNWHSGSAGPADEKTLPERVFRGGGLEPSTFCVVMGGSVCRAGGFAGAPVERSCEASPALPLVTRS